MVAMKITFLFFNACFSSDKEDVTMLLIYNIYSEKGGKLSLLFLLIEMESNRIK